MEGGAHQNPLFLQRKFVSGNFNDKCRLFIVLLILGESNEFARRYREQGIISTNANPSEFLGTERGYVLTLRSNRTPSEPWFGMHWFTVARSPHFIS